MTPIDQLGSLLDVWERLGERERTVALTFLQRLYAGQKRFGKLTSGKKDWTYEALEEAIDGAVYLCAALSDKVEKAFDSSIADAEAEVTKERTVE